ncbi:MAG: cache domain-containing protein, partial [Oscillospiraceae bacterium]|nr:cache domain-containing protein [Oscillospiraceae bacterium]
MKRILPTLLLIVGILAAFFGFIRNNSLRIAGQNEEYINELTTQRAISVDNLIAENLTFIHSTAYLYGKNLDSPFADVAVIRDYEENTIFDYLRFVDESGDDYTSRGVMANLKGRAYIQAALSGETGVVYVPESEVTGKRLVGFYSPVYFQERIIGVMVGFYQEEYIRSLL